MEGGEKAWKEVKKTWKEDREAWKEEAFQTKSWIQTGTYDIHPYVMGCLSFDVCPPLSP